MPCSSCSLCEPPTAQVVEQERISHQHVEDTLLVVSGGDRGLSPPPSKLHTDNRSPSRVTCTVVHIFSQEVVEVPVPMTEEPLDMAMGAILRLAFHMLIHVCTIIQIHISNIL